MRTRDKKRIVRMFMDGESIRRMPGRWAGWLVTEGDVEQVLRDEIRRKDERIEELGRMVIASHA